MKIKEKTCLLDAKQIKLRLLIKINKNKNENTNEE